MSGSADASIVAGLLGSIGNDDAGSETSTADVWRTSEDLLLDAAEVHGVAPALARYARRHDVASLDARKRLEEIRAQQLIRQLSITAEIGPAGTVLTEQGVDWAVLKGPAIASTLWPSPEMREYHDLDLLIRPDHYAGAVETLESAGFRLLDQNWPLIRRQFRGELTFLSPRGVVLDVHWSTVNLAALRAQLRWSMNDLLARRHPVSLGSVTAPTLDPVDTLLHLAYHAAHSGAHRLLWLKDVQLAAHTTASERHALRERARDARLDLIVGAVLDRVALLFDDETVRTVARCLPPSPWRDVMRRRDAKTGPLRPLASGGTHRGLFTSTRTTFLGSAVAALDEGRRHLLARAETGSTPASNPLHQVVRDDDARSDFMTQVRRSAHLDA